MLYYLYGPDSYRKGGKLREILGTYKKKHEHSDIFTANLEENPDVWKDAARFARQPSMFTDSKVIVVFESGVPEDKEWKKFLKDYADSKRAFRMVSDISATKAAFRFLIERAEKAQEFAELTGAPLVAFIKEEAASRDLEFDVSSIKLFAAHIEAQKECRSWSVISELEEMRLLGVSKISSEIINKYFDYSGKDEVYSASRKILNSLSLPLRLAALEKMFFQNEAPAYVFNSLGFQAYGRDAAELAKYDVLVKSGKIEYEEALLDFVLRKR